MDEESMPVVGGVELAAYRLVGFRLHLVNEVLRPPMESVNQQQRPR